MPRGRPLALFVLATSFLDLDQLPSAGEQLLPPPRNRPGRTVRRGLRLVWTVFLRSSVPRWQRKRRVTLPRHSQSRLYHDQGARRRSVRVRRRSDQGDPRSPSSAGLTSTEGLIPSWRKQMYRIKLVGGLAFVLSAPAFALAQDRTWEWQ